ncbi:MAG TPA: rhomboid family intramembrane serine protease [Thermoleophilaceae bacterium]|jgi:membrane associated rhomboid family serine protease
MEVCYRHPDRETGVSCSNCGRPICPDCMTTTSVGMRCPECSRERTRVVRGTGPVGQPTLTYVLIGINVAVALGTFLSGGTGAAGIPGGSVVDDGALSRATVDHGDLWRLVTAGFIHAGPTHLIFNMLGLWVLGGLLEPVVGRLHFALIYFVSLLGGSFGALLLQPNGFTVGASGAIFGLLGAGIIVLRSRGVDPMESGLVFWLGINLVFSFTLSGISIGGHLGGLFGGGLAAIVLYELAPRFRLSKAVAIAATAAIGVVAVAGSIAISGKEETTPLGLSAPPSALSSPVR